VHRWCLLGFMSKEEGLICEECIDLYREACEVMDSFAPPMKVSYG